MKKTLLLAASLFALTAIPAAADETPEKGDFSTEVQFNPFDQDGNMFKLESLKFRYFLTDKDALRLNFGFNIDGHKNQPDKDDDDQWTKEKSGSFNLDFGYERHFIQKGRLDFYAGGQLGIKKDFVSAKEQTTYSYGSDKKKIHTVEYHNRNASGSQRAKFGFSMSGFTGLDFYVYKGLYVGTELGFRFNTLKNCETEVDDGEDKIKSKDSYRSYSSKFYIEPCLRLGWKF